MNKEYSELLELQNRYRKGAIREEDIPKNKLEKLKKLYNAQIKAIENSIKEDKEEILKIRKKISGKY